jgi:hypothetical protein
MRAKSARQKRSIQNAPSPNTQTKKQSPSPAIIFTEKSILKSPGMRPNDCLKMQAKPLLQAIDHTGLQRMLQKIPKKEG